MPITSNTVTPATYFPGLSYESFSSLTLWIDATINIRDTRLYQRIDTIDVRLDRLSQIIERFIGELSINRPENSRFPSTLNPPYDPLLQLRNQPP